jgi:hypothetical protein
MSETFSAKGIQFLRPNGRQVEVTMVEMLCRRQWTLPKGGDE